MEWIDIRHELPWLGRETIHLVNDAAQAALTQALVDIGFKIIALDGSTASDKGKFFDELRRAFDFPAYFGHNWDAFHDSFSDLAYAKERRLAILWLHASTTLEQNLGLLLKGVHEFLVGASYLGRVVEPGDDSVQVELFLLGNSAAFDRKPPDL